MKVTPKGPDAGRIVMKTRAEKKSFDLQWWAMKDEDEAAEAAFETADFLKENQTKRFQSAELHARLYGNVSLYGFATPSTALIDRSINLKADRPTFNLIQAATDTLVSRLGQSRPRPTFLTDGGNSKQRSLSKKLNGFLQGEFFRTKTYEIGTEVLRDACVTGTGVAHVFKDEDNQIGLERVLLTELLVDPSEAMYGKPRQLYRVKLVDREVLLANFPEHREKILKAETSYLNENTSAKDTIADLITVVEGWHLRSGKKAKDGRHILAIDSGFLVSEDYDKSSFPFVFLHYAPRILGFWAQGTAERLMGTQIELNNILYTISRSLKLTAVPRVFQEEGSKVSSASYTNEIGVVVKYKGVKPSFEVAPSNAPELYAERDKLIQYGFQQEGISFMQATSQKPAGLDSGEAVRSYDDISSDRFAALSRRYDNFYIELAYLMTDTAIDISEEEGSYSTIYPGKNSIERIDLPKASLIRDAYVIQCYTQSSLPKDPSGRFARVVEMVQAGMISVQEGRRLLDYPDLEQVEKLANAAEERILRILDEIVEDGKYTPPDPYVDLELAKSITPQYINLYACSDISEDRMQLLRDFNTQVVELLTQAQSALAPAPAAPGVPPNAPQARPEALPTSPLVPNVPQ